MQFKVGNGLEIKRGNRKMPGNTLIFNMGPASCCPSKALGMCRVPDGHCYAYCDERFFGKPVVEYRLRQMQYWLKNDSDRIWRDFHTLFEKHRKALRHVDYLRYNESGDFWSQSCVTKLNAVATYLKEWHDVVTFGFSAREDLDFSNATFLVKGSGCDNGNNGKSIVINNIEELPKGYYLCPGDCQGCSQCSKMLPHNSKHRNVAFQLHR